MRLLNLLVLAAFVSGCALTPGVIPSMGGRMVIEREFHDPDTSYIETMKLPAGTDASDLSRFSLRLKDGTTEYEVGIDSEKSANTVKQAEMLIKNAEEARRVYLESIRAAETLVPGIVDALKKPPAPSPVSVPVTLPDFGELLERLP